MNWTFIFRSVAFGLLFAIVTLGTAIAVMDAGPTDAWGWFKLATAFLVAFATGIFTYTRDPEAAWKVPSGVGKMILAFVLVLLASSAEARSLASFNLPDMSTAVTVQVTLAKGDAGNGVRLIKLRFVTDAGPIRVVTTEDGTVAIIDLAPDDRNAPAWFDRGLCSIRGMFPEKGKAVGDFVLYPDCLVNM